MIINPNEKIHNFCFENVLPFILLFLSINAVSSNLVFIVYLLYFSFPILILIDHFDNPKTWQLMSQH